MKIATVAWSGGLDSTVALHKILTSGEYDHVSAHHVKLLSREGYGRVEAEKRACHDLVPLFRSEGFNFKYNESEYEALFDTVAEVGDLMLLITPTMHALKEEYYLHPEATELNLVFGDHAAEFARTEFSVRWTYISLVFKAFWNAVFLERPTDTTPVTQIYCPNQNDTKEDIYLYLPEEYRELTTSCRKGSNCGNCDPCLDIEAIRIRNYGEEDIS